MFCGCSAGLCGLCGGLCGCMFLCWLLSVVLPCCRVRFAFIVSIAKHFVVPIVCCHLLSGILSLCVFVRGDWRGPFGEQVCDDVFLFLDCSCVMFVVDVHD